MWDRLLLPALVVVCGCGTEPVQGEPAWFPADYRETYLEARTCRLSLEHSAYIRVLTPPDVSDAYARTQPFADGALLLKEQYAQGDVTCSRPIKAFTVMRKLPMGSSPTTLDWEWQEVGTDLRERAVEIENCVGCHDTCGKAPMGYDGTCSEPL